MEKHKYTGKTKEEAIKKAQEELQELEENLFIKEIAETKGGLFKSKKIEIEVIEKREIVKEIKDYILKLLKNIRLNANIEVQNKQEIPKYTIYSDNDALLIGRNGKNLKALTTIVKEYIANKIGEPYKFTIDINDYQEKREQSLIHLAKKTAREVAATKVDVKLDSMNSYERRIIHNALANSKKVYTKSEGEEPNRCVVIKSKEE